MDNPTTPMEQELTRRVAERAAPKAATKTLKATDKAKDAAGIVNPAKLPPLPALPKMPRAAKPKTNSCECGCGSLTAARFVPGHDSRLKGWALRVERNLIKLADIPHAGEREAVRKFLARKGK